MGHATLLLRRSVIVLGSDWMTDMLWALKQALAAMLTFWVGANITILLGL